MVTTYIVGTFIWNFYFDKVNVEKATKFEYFIFIVSFLVDIYTLIVLILRVIISFFIFKIKNIFIYIYLYITFSFTDANSIIKDKIKKLQKTFQIKTW
ncbi:hypothetical protein [Mycoplasmopsis synoviae]|uniref:hypothetical protein n=1 Tax=Mycoplasmopsis synoviae TaxID=2109 RepID=UPI00035FCE5E|nr:hypothetical protein [Mycoplasmopsis synoviae]AKB11033.1 hypothetical protein VY93_01575 [Mycoplasmopsis synoviae ATCC 25204]